MNGSIQRVPDGYELGEEISRHVYEDARGREYIVVLRWLTAVIKFAGGNERRHPKAGRIMVLDPADGVLVFHLDGTLGVVGQPVVLRKKA